MKKRIIGFVLSIVLVMGSPFVSYASENIPEETDSLMMVESMGFADEDLELAGLSDMVELKNQPKTKANLNGRIDIY